MSRKLMVAVLVFMSPVLAGAEPSPTNECMVHCQEEYLACRAGCGGGEECVPYCQQDKTECIQGCGGEPGCLLVPELVTKSPAIEQIPE